MAQQQQIASRLWTLAKHPQFIWWLGHCVVLFCSFFYFYYWITFRAAEGKSYYYNVYLGAMLSYGVVVYKSAGIPQLNREYFMKLNRDENVFYLGLAVLWFFNTPVIVTILPYATFSLFHLITYFRTNILQTFFPQSRQSHSSRESHSSRAPKLSQYEKWANSASKFISTWVHQNYDQAMRIVSFFEVVVITSMLIWNVLTFHLKFYILFAYFFFLRMRFYMNKFTTQTFRDVGNYLDRLLLPPSANPNIPPFVTKAYQHAKSAVIWAGRQGRPQ